MSRSGNLPPAAVLPERLIHSTGRFIAGQYAGMMGKRRDPWFIEASPFDPRAYGAFPEYEFDHQERPRPNAGKKVFQAPRLSLPEGVLQERFDDRLALMRRLDGQRRALEQSAGADRFGKFHEGAVSEGQRNESSRVSETVPFMYAPTTELMMSTEKFAAL